MRNSFFLFFVFVSLVFCTCTKENGSYLPIVRSSSLTRDIDTINRYICGSWEWLEEFRVTRYYGAQYFTPNSPGFHHLTLRLLSDTAKFFVDNVPDTFYRFKIQREFEISNYPADSMPVLVYYNLYSGQRVSYVPILVCKDQLLMQHQYVSSFVGENLWIRR